MPELPEVEILAREMRQNVAGKVLKAITPTAGQELEQGHARLPDLVGRPLTGVRRYGKRLALDFGGGLSLLTHLMMVGQWRYSALTDVVPPDVKLTLAFEDGTRLLLSGVHLRFQQLLPSADVEALAAVEALGPDALTGTLDAEAIGAALTKRSAAIKAVLLTQELVGGIGNTYADEALWVAAISPHRKASGLSADDVARLLASIRQVMQESIDLGGASEMAFVHLDGSKGHYQECFRVKGREGEPCFRCAAPIAKDRTAGRPTYYCPGCQV